MPSEDPGLLKLNQHQKSNKSPFIIFANLEYIIEKIDRYKINPENLSTKNVSKHIPSSFLISTISYNIYNHKNKHDVYTSKDCMKKICEFLREHAMKIKRKN